MKNKKILSIILICLILIALGLSGYHIYLKINANKSDGNTPEVLTDAQKFASEYKTVDEKNVFVYKNIDEIINILEHGTGVVYLGFPECPWCQAYIKLLNNIAKENDVDKIYYYDIFEDRANNTEKYQKVVSILKDYLQYDDEGKPRIFVPDVTIVIDGKIIGHDCETSKDTGGFSKPEEYWNDKKIASLDKKLTKVFKKLNATTCTDCNAS